MIFDGQVIINNKIGFCVCAPAKKKCSFASLSFNDMMAAGSAMIQCLSGFSKLAPFNVSLQAGN